MGYATVTRGYKGPTFDDSTYTKTRPVALSPEIPTSYEVGVKGDILQNRLAVDLNVFHTEVKDFQAQICEGDEVRGVICATENISKIVSQGVELDAFGNPLPGLSINAGMIFADTHYPKGYLGSDGTNLGEKQVEFAPKWKLVLSGEYTHEILNGVDGFIGGDGDFKSEVRYYPSSNADYSFQAHWIFGGRIGVRFGADHQYEVAVFGKNLANTHEPVLMYPLAVGSGLDNFAGGPSSSPSNAHWLNESSYRTVGLSLGAKF